MVGSDISSDTTLLDYLRSHLDLRGTKFMCREGSCGACIVSITENPGETPKSVNACLVSIASCQDWEITTVEAVGNWHDGYHPIQKAIAAKHGTQCGYCTPGWVMAMFSLLKRQKKITVEELEKSFGSNLCRCTGYRPIIEALRLVLKDPSNYELPDIEELKICNKTEKPCKKTSCNVSEWCFVNKSDIKDEPRIKITLKDGKLWHVVEKTSDIFDILAAEGEDSYMLISGNTAKGAYPIEEYNRILIDISRVQELKGYTFDQNLIVGAGTKISDLMDIFDTIASNEQYFRYLKKLRDHLDLVAHIPVRNIGSIAGNLMIKHQHREFPSDIFMLCEAVGANVTILSPGNVRDTVTMQQFLDTDMRGKVLFNVLFQPLNEEYSFESYKIMPRGQNAHAILNSGFLFKTSKNDNKVIECKIVYGGLSESFIRATTTEELLVGKYLFNNETLQEAVSSLEKELPLVENPPEPSAKYRKHLAIALFYKCLLSLCPPDKLDTRYRSGATDLKKTRPVSKALHEYTTDPSIYPLNQPIQKVEALIQTAGEASYTEDLPSLKREVFAAYVTSTVALATIDSIDPSKALKCPGVVAFYSAKDIPGQNNFIPVGQLIYVKEEEVLCSGEVKYYDQPIGVIVAETYHIAERAAKMVEVKYKNIKKPVIDIKVAKKDPSRNELFLPIPAINRGIDIAKVIKTEYTVYGQHHFCMETMCCVTVPTGEGLEVHATTQWSDAVQVCISKALKIPQSKINVYVPRLGGAYGVKISRNTQLAIACSLVSQTLNRPCRFIQSLPSMMKSVGKRLPCSATFEVGVNKSGVIQYMNYNIYEDVGYINSELMVLLGIDAYYNCYDRLRWNYKCYSTITDSVKNTYCRAPVTLEHISMAEWIMEQISYELGLDPLDVRFANIDLIHYADYKEMVKNIKDKSQYQERRDAVNKFNQENRWKKRGLRWSIMKWSPLTPSYFNVNLSVFHGDGTVIISHGGVEMGQSINTTAVQVCAHILNIPMEKIQIKRHDSTTTPNSFISGSSVTTQNIARGVAKCCRELLLRLAPVRLLLLNPPWEVLIKRAFALNIDLQVHGFIGDLLSPITMAKGVALAEAEIDVLTGEFQILRVDLMEDVGRSVNPEVDVGQIEGAFIMGMGYWTSEKIVYSDSGRLLSDRIWNYHVPQLRDIPQDFRVYFKQNSFSTDSLQGAKVTGEPPIVLSSVIPFAIREGIVAARLDCGLPSTDWFEIDGSYTVENVCMATATNSKSYKFM